MIKSSVCITQLNNKVISWLDVNSKMEMLSVSDCVSDIIGNIYVGKVKHVLKNLDACFVEFCPCDERAASSAFKFPFGTNPLVSNAILTPPRIVSFRYLFI